jgi:hypothetical protein
MKSRIINTKHDELSNVVASLLHPWVTAEVNKLEFDVGIMVLVGQQRAANSNFLLVARS